MIDVGRQTPAASSHQSTGTSQKSRSHVLVSSAWWRSSRVRDARSDQPAGSVVVAIDLAGTLSETLL
jgi:hypothetical protein